MSDDVQSSSPRTFTVASRDVTAHVDLTIRAVENALQSFPDANIVRADQDIGVVIIQVPEQQIAKLRAELGDGFMIDPNAPLRL
jgi:DNA-binding transcriptional ArsR family regulator